MMLGECGADLGDQLLCCVVRITLLQDDGRTLNACPDIQQVELTSQRIKLRLKLSADALFGLLTDQSLKMTEMGFDLAAIFQGEVACKSNLRFQVRLQYVRIHRFASLDFHDEAKAGHGMTPEERESSPLRKRLPKV